MNNCKLPDCFPTSIESFETLPVELTNNCEYTLYGCEPNKKVKEKEILDEKFELISKEYNFLPLKHNKIGGCAGTRYGCDASENSIISPEVVKTKIEPELKTKTELFDKPVDKSKQIPRLIGGCAGTRYGCDTSGNTRRPPTESELVDKSADKLIETPLIGGCAGTRYGCDANGNAREPPIQPELIKVVPEQNRIVSESKAVKSEKNIIVSESKNIIISEKINDYSYEYNIIDIVIVVIMIILVYFLFRK